MDATRLCHFALIAEQFTLDGGGAERNLEEVARHLRDRGHRVTILAGTCPPGTAMPDVRIERCPTGKPRHAVRMWLFSRWVSKRLASGAFDASLSITSAVPATVIQPLNGVLPQLRRRMVAMQPTPSRRWLKQLSLCFNAKHWMLGRLERRHYTADARVKRIAVISPFMAEQLQQWYGLSDDRLALIRNAVEMEPVGEDDCRRYRHEVRREYGIPSDAVVFLFPSMDPVRKGLRPLLQAVAELARRGVAPDAFRVVIAGKVDKHSQRLIDRPLVGRHVVAMGIVKRMTPLFCAADVMAMPTFYDPASRVVMEALRRGLAVISSVYDGSTAFLERPDGTSAGRVVADPADSGAIAAAMAELLDPATLAAAKAATAGLGDDLTMARHAAELEALLMEVASESQTGTMLGSIFHEEP
jgi:UDP-glucose:(heptosyl)LPS alpha-1,3-glucosyltransferase